MDYCKYHPDVSAVYQCYNCHYSCCNDCVDQTQIHQFPRCYLCNEELHPILNSDTITPFWRRLPESFRYPMSMDALMLIGGSALLLTVVSFLPFSIVFQLMILGGLFKYSFSCLESTAKGNFKAPDITKAYGSGFNLILQIIFLVIAVFAIIGATHYYLGSMLGSIVGVILISGLPAMIINFALTENILEALNPVSMIRLMTSVGLPYGLLIAFMMVMSGSVGVIHQLLSTENYSFISSVLQSVVANYYTVVIFQIMGYMIYQYQDELGFETHFTPQSDINHKSVVDSGLSHIDILLKEGQYQEAVRLFESLLDSYPNEERINNQYLELLLATRDVEQLDRIADNLLLCQLKAGNEDKLLIIFQRISTIVKGYKPHSPDLRFRVAKIFFAKSDFKMVVKLLNGMQKDCADSPVLGVSFMLMASALDNIPNMKNQADKCREFANLLERKQQNRGKIKS